MDMEGAIKQLQETAIVMAGIQARQAEVLKGHGEWLEEHQKAVAKHDQMMIEFDRKMIEIEDKLNGLIGYMDGRRSKPE